MSLPTTHVFNPKSARETKHIASVLGALVRTFRHKGQGAFCMTLEGALGAGKTTFTQGFASGLGIRSRILSPTFILMKRYPLTRSTFKNMWHIDCYRIKNARELDIVGFKKILADTNNIIVIEWPERIRGRIPYGVLAVLLKHRVRDTRRITIRI